MDNEHIKRASNYRGIFPGTFTMGNVVCGFLSIMSSFEGNITAACWFVILAAFLDVLDGKVARFSGGTTQFGVELDSLADFLSFGVAPAMLVYSLKLDSMGKWGWIISLVYIMAAAYRLARYNLFADTDEKKGFVGLPVPAAAISLVAYVILSYFLWGGLKYGELLISMIILNAFLMVSQIPYEGFPERFDTLQHRIMSGAALVAAVSIIFKPRLLLFPFIALYILNGMIRELIRLFSRGVNKVASKSDHEQSK